MGVRASAVRRAAQVRAERKTALVAREKQIAKWATAYFVADGQAKQVMAAAQERCRQVMTAAETATGQARSDAAAAVAGLQALGLSQEEIGKITGLTARQVRDVLAVRPDPAPPGGQPAPDSGRDRRPATDPARAGRGPSPAGDEGPTPDPGPEDGYGPAVDAPTSQALTARQAELAGGQPGTTPARGGDPRSGAVSGRRMEAEEAAGPK